MGGRKRFKISGASTKNADSIVSAILVWLPELVLFVALAHLYLFCMPVSFGDDAHYASLLNDRSLMGVMALYWSEWSSRVLWDALAAVFASLPYLFAMSMHVVVWMGIQRAIVVLLSAQHDRECRWIVSLLLLCYPFANMAEAGPVITPLYYLYPLLALLLAIIILKKLAGGGQTRLRLLAWVLVYAVLLVWAADVQQLAVVMVLLFSFLLYRSIRHRLGRRSTALCSLGLGMGLLGLAVAALSPGAAIRFAREATTWWPSAYFYSPVAWEDVSLVQKLYLGVVSTVDRYLYPLLGGNPLLEGNICLLLCVGSLVALQGVRKRGRARRALMMFGIASIALLVLVPEVSKHAAKLSGVPILWHLFTRPLYDGGETRLILSLCEFALLCTTVALMVFGLSGKRRTAALFLFIAGAASRGVMAFSPTLFASGNRTFFFLDLALLSIVFLAVMELRDAKPQWRCAAIGILGAAAALSCSSTSMAMLMTTAA